MAVCEGSGDCDCGDVTAQDYDFLCHNEAATAEYDSGVGSAGMEGFGAVGDCMLNEHELKGIPPSGKCCKQGINYFKQSFDQVRDIHPML